MCIFSSVLLAIILSPTAFSAITYYSVRDYRSRADNPFVTGLAEGTVYLETFETQFGRGTNELTTPHVTAWNGGTTGAAGWSVQEDYKSTDPDGGMGWVWGDNVGAPLWRKDPPGIHFDFSADEFGRYPEYVGAALLGYDDLENVGGLYNSIFVYDKYGNEVTGGEWKLPRLHYTEDDLDSIFTDFEGIYVPGGISRIQFRDFAYVDHLTYGYAPIPEPGALSLAGVAAASLLRRGSRKRTV